MTPPRLEPPAGMTRFLPSAGCGLAYNIVWSSRGATPTVNQALGNWLQTLKDQWFAAAPEILAWPRRMLYSYCGSLFWAFFFFLSYDSNPLLQTPSALRAFLLDPDAQVIALTVVPFFFAWLVSWPKRRYTPTRLFLGGLLLPTAAVSIVSLSLIRFPRVVP